MEKTQILNLQKKFIYIHNLIMIILSLYIIFLMSEGYEYMQALKGIVVLFLFHFVNMVFVYKNYFNNINMLKVMKLIQMVIVAYIALVSTESYMQCVLICMYMLCCIEYSNIIEVFDFYDKLVVVVTISIPLVFMFTFFAIKSGHILEMIIKELLFLMAFDIIFIGVLNIVIEFLNKCYDTINNQIWQLEDLEKNNQSILINQEKIKIENDLLGRQKIELKQANKIINQVNKEMYAQSEILKFISSSLEIPKLMDVVTEAIMNTIDIELCSIFIDKNVYYNSKVKCKVKTKKELKNIIELIDKQSENIYQNICNVNKDWIVDDDVDYNVYEFLTDDTIKSLIFMPIRLQNREICGLFLAGSKSKNMFKEHKAFYETIVSQFSIAIENAKMYAEMENLAVRDGLTGIYNRRYFTKLFQGYIDNAIFNNDYITVSLFDIDKFKNVNDTYGHLFGDEVIKTVSRIAGESVDANEGIFCRYGGEEFLMAFYNKNVEETLPIIEEIHRKIKEEILYCDGKEVHINVSIGVTCYPTTCKDPNSLLNRADWSMYYSKQHGRGCITVDNEKVIQGMEKF